MHINFSKRQFKVFMSILALMFTGYLMCSVVQAREVPTASIHIGSDQEADAGQIMQSVFREHPGIWRAITEEMEKNIPRIFSIDTQAIEEAKEGNQFLHPLKTIIPVLKPNLNNLTEEQIRSKFPGSTSVSPPQAGQKTQIAIRLDGKMEIEPKNYDEALLAPEITRIGNGKYQVKFKFKKLKMNAEKACVGLSYLGEGQTERTYWNPGFFREHENPSASNEPCVQGGSLVYDEDDHLEASFILNGESGLDQLAIENFNVGFNDPASARPKIDFNIPPMDFNLHFEKKDGTQYGGATYSVNEEEWGNIMQMGKEKAEDVVHYFFSRSDEFGVSARVQEEQGVISQRVQEAFSQVEFPIPFPKAETVIIDHALLPEEQRSMARLIFPPFDSTISRKAIPGSIATFVKEIGKEFLMPSDQDSEEKAKEKQRLEIQNDPNGFQKLKLQTLTYLELAKDIDWRKLSSQTNLDVYEAQNNLEMLQAYYLEYLNFLAESSNKKPDEIKKFITEFSIKLKTKLDLLRPFFDGLIDKNLLELSDERLSSLTTFSETYSRFYNFLTVRPDLSSTDLTRTAIGLATEMNDAMGLTNIPQYCPLDRHVQEKDTVIRVNGSFLTDIMNQLALGGSFNSLAAQGICLIGPDPFQIELTPLTAAEKRNPKVKVHAKIQIKARFKKIKRGETCSTPFNVEEEAKNKKADQFLPVFEAGLYPTEDQLGIQLLGLKAVHTDWEVSVQNFGDVVFLPFKAVLDLLEFDNRAINGKIKKNKEEVEKITTQQMEWLKTYGLSIHSVSVSEQTHELELRIGRGAGQ